MKIGIIQASSQKTKNSLLVKYIRDSIPPEYELVNFGIYENANESLSYIQIALCICFLLESQSVDFIVTGCSSGQGMMLACNSLPGVICGYVETVTDAYLFARINDGNAISYPLGYNFGWASEINLKASIKALFCEPMGNGYPVEDSERKKRDTEHLKQMNSVCKKSLTEILPLIDSNDLHAALSYDPVFEYLLQNGKNTEVVHALKNYKDIM